MALKPILKLKVDELFLRWLSDPDIQQILQENLRQIVQDQPISDLPTTLSGHGGADRRTTTSTSTRPASPRSRPGSPSTPPCSPPPGRSSPSPRSPRRSFSSKLISRVNSVKSKDSSKDAHRSPPPTDLVTSAVPQNINIPPFYFPLGRPTPGTELERDLKRVAVVFSTVDGGKVFRHQMEQITKALDVPFYWKSLIFVKTGGDKLGYITQQAFNPLWKRVAQSCHDDASRFVKLLAKPNCNYLVQEDFIPLIQDIVDTHPGLGFLQDAAEFHSRYVHTVIARIFYCVNRSWSGKISISEVRRSNFLSVLSLLEDEDDINQITDYFSYEHFYVIYCKFWELDKDHDLSISKEDLARHNENAISSKMVDRIFSGAVTRGSPTAEGTMSYTDFAWFLLSEEDKKNPTAIEYWFRCMDLDGDGVLSMYEMEYFYNEQVERMENLGIETLPFSDCLCQMLDLVKPKMCDRILLSDLKACKMTPIFFDTFFNLDKYLEHEQKDPFANQRELDYDGPEQSDWDRYAAEEYDILVAEEANAENQEQIYEDDFEPDEEFAMETEKLRLDDPPLGRNRGNMNISGATNDDLYDFSSEDLGY